MKKEPIRKRIYHLTGIGLVLLLLLVTCGCMYYKNNANIENNNGIKGNETEEALPGKGDEAADYPKEQASGINGEDISNPAGEEQSNSADEGQVTGSDKGLTENDKLALYSGLPYFISENTERYIEYKVKNPDYSYEQVITYVNIGLDYSFYEKVNMIDNGDDITVLVNKYNKLPDDYKPDLVQLDQSMCASGVGPQYLRKEAYEAFVKMHNDAMALGLNITAYGTYRSIQTQHRIWNNAVNSGRTVEDVDSLNARGGHSEHHTGLAVDVIINNYSVEETEEFKWYSENAHKYGFIIRYPNGKENITGYKYEPWHLRYVGPDIAKEVYEKGITYDEYYVQVLQPEKVPH